MTTTKATRPCSRCVDGWIAPPLPTYNWRQCGVCKGKGTVLDRPARLRKVTPVDPWVQAERDAQAAVLARGAAPWQPDHTTVTVADDFDWDVMA